MHVEIINKDLLKLYETGKSNKYRLPSQIVDKYIMRVAQIQAAMSIRDLTRRPINFEKYKNHYSVRLDNKFRLELNVEWTNEEKTIGSFFIYELNNHYGD